jgi:GntR family histidine utilization transcriptional repressor
MPVKAALYQQIKDHVLRQIQAGEWVPGFKLPSENDLVQQFGVSRMTVNRALRELLGVGRIVRVAGVGSFVAQPKAQANLLQIVNLADEVRARGHAYRCDVRVVERVSAPAEVAAALDVLPGASVFHTVCVHFEDEVAVQLEDRYVNPRAAPDFGLQDFTLVRPSEYLLSKVPLDQIEHVVDAVMPTVAQAALLQMEVDQPCLLLTRRTWLRSIPITYVRCWHPGTRYRLGSRFDADTGMPMG